MAAEAQPTAEMGKADEGYFGVKINFECSAFAAPADAIGRNLYVEVDGLRTFCIEQADKENGFAGPRDFIGFGLDGAAPLDIALDDSSMALAHDGLAFLAGKFGREQHRIQIEESAFVVAGTREEYDVEHTPEIGHGLHAHRL